MAKTFALLFGIVFIVLGVLGFFPNPIVGDSIGALFMADTAHNLVHLVIGLIMAVIALSAPEKSRGTLIFFGVIYIILAVVGFINFGSSGGEGSLWGIDMNSADSWLHVVLGVLLLIIGMASKKPEAATTAPTV